MSFDANDIANRSHLFYRDSYRRVLKLIILLAVIGVGLVAMLFFSLYERPLPNYYATTTAGQVVPMQPLSKPVVTSNYILQWSSQVVRSVLNLDFAHYQQQLKAAQSNFTDDGWSAFQGAMQSTLLSAVEKEKLQVSAVVTGTPIIVSTEVVNGFFTWMVRMPVLLTYTSASASRKQHIYVTVVVRRIPTLNNEKGIQVSGFYTG